MVVPVMHPYCSPVFCMVVKCVVTAAGLYQSYTSIFSCTLLEVAMQCGSMFGQPRVYRVLEEGIGSHQRSRCPSHTQFLRLHGPGKEQLAFSNIVRVAFANFRVTFALSSACNIMSKHGQVPLEHPPPAAGALHLSFT